VVGVNVALAEEHDTIKVFPAGSFARGFTHSVNTSSGILWYNSQTGAGAVGKIDGTGNHITTEVLAPGAFARGWTLITNTQAGILFYNTQTGEGAFGNINANGKFSTTKVFRGGSSHHVGRTV